MSGRTSLARGIRRRKTITLFWIAALFGVVSTLIYWEKTPHLYILATLGVSALLAIVARADLAAAERIGQEGAKPTRDSS